MDHTIDSLEKLRQVIVEPAPILEKKVVEGIDGICRAFIEKSPLVCVATSNLKNDLDVSPKGDAPGFVKVLNESTILIPERPGNHLAFGFRNMIENPKVGVIFIVPGLKETLRINGEAVISKDPELLQSVSVNGKPAILCTIVTVKECFFHCGKAFVRSKIWQADTWPTDASSNVHKHIGKAMDVDEAFIASALEDDYRHNLY
ncbi:MAG: PPOX class probable FMN-dependent enzyme [Halioglobus sp.]|jgi:PPOX class probable FMN-dependent enzyme